MKILLVFFLFIFIQVFLYSVEKPQIKAVMIKNAPVIDGKLNDDCWAKGTPAGNFVEYSTSSTPAARQSSVWVVCDDSNLYFGFKCKEDEMHKLREINTKRETLIFNYSEGENVELFLDPGMSGVNYLQFMVNTSGAHMANYKTGNSLQLGDLPWKSAVFLGDGFFSVEIAIPFSILHLNADSGDVWGINFCRSRMIGKQEPSQMFSSWAPVKGGFGNPRLFGKLLFSPDSVPRGKLNVETNDYVIPGKEWNVLLENVSGHDIKLLVTAFLAPETGVSRKISSKIDLPASKTKTISLGAFCEQDKGALLKFEITDLEKDKIIYIGSTQTEDATPVTPPPARKHISFFKQEVVVDNFDGNKLNGWHLRSLYWKNNKANDIPPEKNKISIEKSGDKRFFCLGSGALKLHLPGGLITDYPENYAVLSKNFNPKHMTHNGILEFWIYNYSGGGKFSVRLVDNKNWKTCVESKKFLLDLPGLHRYTINIDEMSGCKKMWKKLNCIAFTFWGDFTIYLSGIRITSPEQISNKISPQEKCPVIYKKLPVSDKTIAF